MSKIIDTYEVYETPEEHEVYYVPYLGISGFLEREWCNNELDFHYLSNNLICDTKEEAQELSNLFYLGLKI